VVIPVFERLDYLGEAVASVAAQTLRPLELVVVADGDRVDPEPMLADCDLRTRIVSRAHGGPGAARNTGCAAAVGGVLAFLDADDVWLPEKLELQVDALRHDPCLDVVFAGVEQFFSPELGRVGTPKTSARLERATRAGLLPSAMVVRASSFARVGGFREGVIFGEFVDWFARAVELGMCSRTIDRMLVRRRVHDYNAGVQFRSSRGDYARVIKDLLERRREHSAGRVRLEIEEPP